MANENNNENELTGICTLESQNRQNELSKAEVTHQLLALGVKKGGVLLVHTSFRATRPVEGGLLGLIEALRDALGPKGTLVMPSWSVNGDEPLTQ